MSTPVRRRLPRVAAAAFLVLLVPALAACGFNVQTDQVYQPSTGVNDRSGTVDVLGAVIVSGQDGQGTLVASLVNKSETKSDTLSSVTAADPNAGITTRLKAPVEVAANSLVNLADQGAVSLTGESITPGPFIGLVLTFTSGEEVHLNIPVVPQSGYYADIEPADPSPSASPGATPGATPSSAPSSSPSSVPSGSPSPSPSSSSNP
jgi:hypothetical protein